jgi:glycosyltransferase involved in cell wall biosynthesis
MVALSCIIPAYNEAKRIGAVLEVVATHPLINEIIVVDDGSADDTSSVALEFDSVQVIVKAANQGKSRAVCDGIRASYGSVLLLLDADLVGLSADRLTDLMTPVLEGRADFSISLRGNALLPWRWLGLDYVSGERVLHREMIAGSLEEIEALPGFGLEVYMNKLLTKLGSRIKVVPWDDVRSPYKSKKYGFWIGTTAELQMLRNIAQTITLSESASQMNAMLRARV